MAITFPSTPAVNDQFVNSGRTWIWTGEYWQAFTQALSNATVNTAILAANSVTSEKILNGNVTAEKLANTTVTIGSYTSASITVDAQGRLTAASSGASASIDAFDDQFFLGTQVWS